MFTIIVMCQDKTTSRAPFQNKVYPCVGIPILKIRRSWDHLIRRHLVVSWRYHIKELVPRKLLCARLNGVHNFPKCLYSCYYLGYIEYRESGLWLKVVHDGNRNIIILVKFSSLAAPKVVKMITFGGTSDEKTFKQPKHLRPAAISETPKK